MIGENVRKWIVNALEDFRIAGHELSFPEHEISTSPVCFHCQQLVEKLLKAYLVSASIDFEKTHNLEHLLRLCAKRDTDFAKLYVGNMTSYAVEVRYPDEFYIPSVEEARECFELATTIKVFIFKKLELENDEIIKRGGE